MLILVLNVELENTLLEMGHRSAAHVLHVVKAVIGKENVVEAVLGHVVHAPA